MEYRKLGSTGLRVSALGLGTWVTFAEQGELGKAVEILACARQAGINFLDSADGYGRGAAERMLGAALGELGWDRADFVLSTKLYWGVRDCVNMRETLNRKYLMQAIDDSLERLRTPFVDLLLCHRPDPHTPIEETVWAMSDIVAAGKAHYWGTSQWPPERIREAWQIADRYGLRKPVTEQPEYSLLRRDSVEKTYAPLCRDLGLGLTTWSPLGSGVLTGKYRDGIPPGSRASLPGYDWLTPSLVDRERNQRVSRLSSLARQIGASTAQLAIGWCLTNPLVSSVVLGASQPEQLQENLGALHVARHSAPALMEQARELMQG